MINRVGALVILAVAGASGCGPAAKGAPNVSDVDKIEIPAGSGDYREVLTLCRSYKAGAMTFDQLQAAIVGRNLPPYKIGDGYLMTPAPMPPPGVAFDARMMPKDWEKTWGEVAMAYWLGGLTRDEYDRLHRAAHPACPAR